jgi:hypothetical protein
MTQGNIGNWHKKIGDEIVPGDVLVEIETDKAQMDFECQDEGFLAKVLKDAGSSSIKINEVTHIVFIVGFNSACSLSRFLLRIKMMLLHLQITFYRMMVPQVKRVAMLQLQKQRRKHLHLLKKLHQRRKAFPVMLLVQEEFSQVLWLRLWQQKLDLV